MPAVFKLAVAAVATLAVVDAACPNACSGHGQCGQYDACSCHPDWFGGDCSQRVCPHAFAWAVTNANGDINGDGLRTGVTVYDADHTFKQSGFDYVVTQNEPHGTWESWPAFGNTASKDEGHFYMECANRGICDRSTGECACFDGYTGAGCRRTTCPNDCSGHGICKTVGEQAPDGITYELWDKDMSRSCVCDPGFDGIDCSEHKCPLGDDPLTTDQTNAVQWVDVLADREGDTTDNTFAGYIRLKYTDNTGKKWTTKAIEVEPMAEGASDMASKVAEALNELPNGVLSGVTVTQGFAERVIPGNIRIMADDTLDPATNGATSVSFAAGMSMRCVTGQTTANAKLVFHTTDGDDMVTFDDLTPETSLDDVDDATCYQQEQFWSVRFEINFVNTPGNVAPLEVDISGVTIGGKTNAQRGDSKVTSAVTSQRVLGTSETTNGITAEYKVPGEIDHCTGGCSIVSKTVSITALATADLFPDARVKIECADKSRGIFTVLSVADPAFVVKEDIADSDLACATNLRVTMVSHVVFVNADLTGMLSAGDKLYVPDWANAQTTPKITQVKWSAADGIGHIFLDAAHHTSAEAATDGLELVKQQGEASTEGEECSGRGLCDRASGMCKCFKGYTGSACSLQNALSLGFGEF